MGILISKSDFVGKYSISQNAYTTTDLDSYIDYYEEVLLVELLGKSLYDLFVADLVNKVPQSTIYLTIYNKLFVEWNGFEWDLMYPEFPFYYLQQNKLYVSYGMKNMLLAFIYFYFVRQQPFTNTMSGTVRQQGSISEDASPIDFGLYKVFNEGVSDFQTIQLYITQHLSDYSTFKGVTKQYTSFVG